VTALYIASNRFVYAVTKSPEAKAGLRSMQRSSGLKALWHPGFPLGPLSRQRTSIPHPPCYRSASGMDPSPVEKDWYWKGETSDEIDGHYFGWQVFYDLTDDEIKAPGRRHLQAPHDHLSIKLSSFTQDGERPLGLWGPDKLNGRSAGIGRSAGLGCLEMLCI